MSDDMHYHGQPCYYCGEPIDSFAANPGRWNCGPICHSTDPGRVKAHHAGCVMERFHRVEELEARVLELEEELRFVREDLDHALKTADT